MIPSAAPPSGRIREVKGIAIPYLMYFAYSGSDPPIDQYTFPVSIEFTINGRSPGFIIELSPFWLPGADSLFVGDAWYQGVAAADLNNAMILASGDTLEVGGYALVPSPQLAEPGNTVWVLLYLGVYPDGPMGNGGMRKGYGGLSYVERDASDYEP